MLVDMHIHECIHSEDSEICLPEIVERARVLGLDAVCITDHDNMNIRAAAESYTRRSGFPIFTGIEFWSLQGDITAWGIDSYPAERVDAQDFIDIVNEQGGFCVACHPFRNNGRGLGRKILELKGLHGIEVLNGSTDMAANRRALEYCRELGVKQIGVSDAHIYKQIGKYVTCLPGYARTTAEFVEMLHNCDTRAAIWTGSGYEVMESF